MIGVGGDTTGIRTGAPVRGFRSVQYGVYEADGRWWLGRKESSAGMYQKLAGPLRSPANGGLVFSFRDAAGAATTDPLAVHTVEIVVRGESFGKVRGSGGIGPTVRQDSLRTRAFLRG